MPPRNRFQEATFHEYSCRARPERPSGHPLPQFVQQSHFCAARLWFAAPDGHRGMLAVSLGERSGPASAVYGPLIRPVITLARACRSEFLGVPQIYQHS